MKKTYYQRIKHITEHKKVLIKLEKELKGKNSLRIVLHDLDKLMMVVLLPWLSKETVTKIHRRRKHHQYQADKDYQNLTEAEIDEIILDWESARFTKPDKPLTARDFIDSVNPHLKDVMYPRLEVMGL